MRMVDNFTQRGGAMSDAIMSSELAATPTTSDDGYWEFVDGQWTPTEKQLQSPKEESKPYDTESKEIEDPGFNKNILPLFPFIVALLVYSLLSNSWYSAEVLQNDGLDNERVLGQINVGLNEIQFVDVEDSEDVTTNSFQKIAKKLTQILKKIFAIQFSLGKMWLQFS